MSDLDLAQSILEWRWNPDDENLLPYIMPIFAPQISVVGKWANDCCRLEGSTAIVTESAGQLFLEFEAWGCLAKWKLKRSIKIVDGVLRLNEPVANYCQMTFDTLYPVQVDGVDYLLDKSHLRFKIGQQESQSPINWSEEIRYAGLIRITDEDRPHCPKKA